MEDRGGSRENHKLAEMTIDPCNGILSSYNLTVEILKLVLSNCVMEDKGEKIYEDEDDDTDGNEEYKKKGRAEIEYTHLRSVCKKWKDIGMY